MARAVIVLMAAAALAGAAADAEPAPADDVARFSPAVAFEQLRARAKKEGFAKVEESLLTQLAGSEGARSLVLFYMAHGLWPEALSILREQNDVDAELMLFEGIANYQMGRWDDAAAILNARPLREMDAAAAWRGLANARLGAEEAAADDLFSAAAPGAPFEQNAADFFLARADAALGRGEADRARAALEDMRGRTLSDDQRAMRRLIEARLMLAQGKRDAGRNLLQGLAASGPQPAASFAALELLKDGVAANAIDPRAALAKTDALLLTWSGGSFERAALQFKAALYDAVGDVANGFQTRRRLASAFSRSDAAAAAQRAMTENLTTLFDHADLSPLLAAEIFYENIDAAPPGRDGDALIRHVADELAALDLLKQACELLRHQVFKRLRGPARSETAADLADLYLADHRPREALQVLHATRLARLPEALNDRRRWLEAQALIGADDADGALALLADDESAEAARLRGDVFWAAKDWRKAGAAYAASLAAPGDDAKPVEGAAARTALKAAAAFTLAGDRAGLDAFEREIRPRLADDALKILFSATGLDEDPARFFAAYEDYFGVPDGG